MTEPATPPPMMTFGEAIVKVVRNYAQFEGRAARPEFWWWALFAAIVSSALGALNLATPNGTIAIGSSLASVWGVATFVPTLAVTIRRLRDTGRHWGNVFFILIPVAGIIVLIVFLAEPTKAAVTAPPPPPAA
ncbi:MAG: hypothetical protein JWN36_2492 [Microbacteriaceae bacterium]|nr:hypothetical protein [Microbacteriaceae bacterium]